MYDLPPSWGMAGITSQFPRPSIRLLDEGFHAGSLDQRLDLPGVSHMWVSGLGSINRRFDKRGCGESIITRLGGSDDVSHARDRLKGCLQELLDHSDDSSISSQDETLGISHDLIKQMLIKKETIPTPPSTIKLKLKKRRRRRDFVVDRTFHPHTFVMKLFDRSVDLAQFKENSSLYPICRAWMTNQPHNTNLIPKERSPTPEPTIDIVSGEDEGTGSESDSELVKEMYRMPAPKPLPMDDTRYKMRVPSPSPREPEQEVKNETVRCTEIKY
uniref:Protein lin-37 homolog n=1 Tax=Timema douglasi TaxID=61478 RepID=A0A7R8VPW6_TIMDO|nr:unnamed protein product [Timema douglasi]